MGECGSHRLLCLPVNIHNCHKYLGDNHRLCRPMAAIDNREIMLIQSHG
jgi:hypothetical protein